MAIAGDFAYITAQFDDGISVLNIADPTSPTLAGFIKDHTILDNCKGIVVRGNYAYVAGEKYFVSVNITDPSNLTIASSVSDNLQQIYRLNQVVLNGNYAYVVKQPGDVDQSHRRSSRARHPQPVWSHGY